MRIERTLTGVTTLGPGSRIVIWTNGCPRKCPGCVSSRLQRPDPFTEVDVIKHLSQFDFASCDGVTISGGEPFMQKEELLKVLRFLKEKGVDDILVYTGYLYEELLEDETCRTCLRYVDVLIDGPYVDSLNDDTNNLYGSSNQKVRFLNEGLRQKYLAYMKKERRVQEFGVANLLIGVGIPTRDYIREFKEGN